LLTVLGVALAATTALATTTAFAATGSSPSPTATAKAKAPSVPKNAHVEKLPKAGPVTVMLELDTPAAATAYSDAVDAGQSTAAADAASQAQSTKVEALAKQVESHLSDAATKASAIFSTHAAYAGVAVNTDASKLAALARIPGVLAVHPMPTKHITNSVTQPLIRAPQAWQFAGQTGKGVTIGIIDTGIDYTHADFGGPGTVAAYQAALATDTGPFTPTAKVVGGFDFAGDTYDADPNSATYQPVPHPDPNPLDCNSHGTPRVTARTPTVRPTRARTTPRRRFRR
jgi:subtilisin family serine protease